MTSTVRYTIILHFTSEKKCHHLCYGTMPSCHFRLLILIYWRALLDLFRKNIHLSYVAKITWLSYSWNNFSLRIQISSINLFSMKVASTHIFPHNIMVCVIKCISEAVFLKRLLHYCLCDFLPRWWYSLCKFWCLWEVNAWQTATLRLTQISEMSKCEKLYIHELQE